MACGLTVAMQTEHAASSLSNFEGSGTRHALKLDFKNTGVLQIQFTKEILNGVSVNNSL